MKSFLVWVFLTANLVAGPMNYGRAVVGGVSSPQTWPVLVTLGDSITASLQGPDSDFAWPTQIKKLLPLSASSIFNVAVGGRDTVAVLAGFPTEVTPHLPITTGVPGCITTTLVGVNDFSIRDGSSTYANVKLIWSQIRAGGGKVIAFKIAPTTTNPPGSDWDNRRLVFNDLVDSDPSLYDLLLWQVVVMPNPANVYFYQDGTHLQIVGALTMAGYIYSHVNASGLLP